MQNGKIPDYLTSLLPEALNETSCIGRSPDFPCFLRPSHPDLGGTMAIDVQKQNFVAEVGITVAGTAPDFHGIPF